MDRYGSIYLIKNRINEKVYVGQTTYTFNKRYKYSGVGMERVYKYHSHRKNMGLRHNSALINAFLKYGNNSFEIIEDYAVAYSKEELDNLEKSIIKEFDSFKNGYNMSEGGEAVSGLKGALNYKARAVICITTGETFEAINVAVRSLKGHTKGVSPSNIVRCCLGEIPKAGRLLKTGEQLEWAYVEDYEKGIIPCVEKDKEKWVVCLTTNEVFKSKVEASDHFKIHPSRISMQLSGKRPTAGFHPETNEPLFFKKYLSENPPESWGRYNYFKKGTVA